MTILIRKFGHKIREVWKGQKRVVSEKNEYKRSQILEGDHNAMSQYVTFHVINLRILEGCEWISLSLYIIS